MRATERPLLVRADVSDSSLTMSIYIESGLRKFLRARGVLWFDGIFILGCLALIILYFFTRSFETAITIAVFIWVISIAIYLCYRFELVDDYYRKVKSVDQSITTRLVNIFLSISFILSGVAGGFLGAYLAAMLFEPRGMIVLIGVCLGIALGIQIYYRLIIKSLFR